MFIVFKNKRKYMIINYIYLLINLSPPDMLSS